MTDSEWAELDHVRGWLSRTEAEALERYAAGKIVLEIGSYCGKSTIAMARTAVLVVSIDHHRGDSGTGEADTFAEFRANLERFGVANKVIPIVANLEWVERCGTLILPRNVYDMVFVDGEHTYESVSRDLGLATWATNNIIAMHDTHYPDVMRAAEDRGIAPFDDIAGTLGIKRRRKS